MPTNRNWILRRPRMTGAAAAAVLAVAGGLYFTEGSTTSQAAPPAPGPAVPVLVHTLTGQKIRVWSDFSGRLKAVDSAELRPEVGGRITQVLFQDGQDVKEGDVLFVIDPRPYEAKVAQAEADLATAKTNAGFAQLELGRAVSLVKTQAIAQRVYDERANGARVADAAVQAAEAGLKQAQLDLEHAHVRSPITGRASRAEITVGNLVEPGPNAPLLTTIVANRWIYADFEVDEQTYVETVRGHGGERVEARHIPVQLTLAGDAAHGYDGTIDSFDNRIDVATGTIRARAKFENKDGALVPGMFVSVKLAESAEREEVLVPDRAVGFDQSKKFVYVVGPDSKVAYRAVELGKEIDAERVALSGVKAGDRVIVDGVQHVRPEVLVEAREDAALHAQN